MARTVGAVARTYRWARSVAEDYCRPKPPASDGRREPPTQAGLEARLQAEWPPTGSEWGVAQEMPAAETLAKWFRDLRPKVGATPWTLVGAEVSPATRHVVDAMARRVVAGVHPPMTVELARWIERLAVAVPALASRPQLMEAWAEQYATDEASGGDGHLLDWGLGLQLATGGLG